MIAFAQKDGTLAIDGPSIFGIPLGVDFASVAAEVSRRLESSHRDLERARKHGMQGWSAATFKRVLRHTARDCSIFFYVRTNEHADWDEVGRMVAWVAWHWRKKRFAERAASRAFDLACGVTP